MGHGAIDGNIPDRAGIVARLAKEFLSQFPMLACRLHFGHH